jgi:hypothetical protein
VNETQLSLLDEAPTRSGDHKRVLTAADVRAIRASTDSLRTLAARYGGPLGLSPGTVHAIKKGRTWKWVF